MPVYIHPCNPPDVPFMYHNHPELWGPVWSWTVETGNHALRIVFARVFDRFPGAKLILGHRRATLPFQLWRFDNSREISNRGAMRLDRPPSTDFRRNVWVTTAGVCSDEPLRCTLDAMGRDRVMLSADHPFERAEEAGHRIERAAITDDDRRRVCHDTAAALLMAPLPAAARIAATRDRIAPLAAMGSDLKRGMVGGTIALCRPLHKDPAASPGTVRRDIACGPHARNRLDLYLPPEADGTQPVAVIVHGGGFMRLAALRAQ